MVADPGVPADQLLPRLSGYRRTALLRRDRVVVAGLVVLAGVLRLPNLGRAYWIDEGISVGIASHPLSQLPKLLREDGSPPLFYVLLHFWVKLFGTSEAATHTLPLLISLSAIPVAYWAGRELFERRAAIWAAALMATNPFLNWYSTETRMYTLVVVLATVGLTLAIRAFRDRRPRDAAGATLVYAALLYTHDWGIYLTVVTALVLGWMAWSRRDRTRYPVGRRAVPPPGRLGCGCRGYRRSSTRRATPRRRGPCTPVSATSSPTLVSPRRNPRFPDRPASRHRRVDRNVVDPRPARTRTVRSGCWPASPWAVDRRRVPRGPRSNRRGRSATWP